MPYVISLTFLLYAVSALFVRAVTECSRNSPDGCAEEFDSVQDLRTSLLQVAVPKHADKDKEACELTVQLSPNVESADISPTLSSKCCSSEQTFYGYYISTVIPDMNSDGTLRETVSGGNNTILDQVTEYSNDVAASCSSSEKSAVGDALLKQMMEGVLQLLQKVAHKTKPSVNKPKSLIETKDACEVTVQWRREQHPVIISPNLTSECCAAEQDFCSFYISSAIPNMNSDGTLYPVVSEGNTSLIDELEQLWSAKDTHCSASEKSAVADAYTAQTMSKLFQKIATRQGHNQAR